jgi:hypothetical protein
MRYPSLAAQTTLRQDILKGILPHVLHRAGIASALKPALRRLPGLTDHAGIGADGSALCMKARGDIITALPRRISITNISVIHPLSVQILSFAPDTAGAAASFCNQQKKTTYTRVEPNGYGFVPFSVETHGRLGHPAMNLLYQPGDEAAGAVGVCRASFVSGARA